MTHQPEYHANMVALLEMIWGEGYMAPGGPGNVAKMLRGIDTRGKRLLDIGCGIGGPAIEMARRHGAEVVGIDLEQPLVEMAQRAAAESGVDDRCSFRCVQPGPLPFDAASFDIAVSSGAVTQTRDKAGLLAEAYRLLRPGGWLSCYEWMGNGQPLSDAMRDWIRLEGLTYNLWTLDDYRELLGRTGFDAVVADDATGWYREEARREYDRLRGPLYERMATELGREDADHFVENWRAMIIVIDRGEMRQGYFRGRKPAGSTTEPSDP